MLPMNRVALWILAQIIFLISAQAVPPVLNYAGQVAVNGEAFDGNGLFKFALVNADGTTTYWSNDGTSVDGSEPQASVSVVVNGGLYSILLGNTAQQGMGAIDPAVFAQHTDAKLRVWFSDGVNGFQQLSPDRPFASVPYAFSAGSAFIANGSISKSMLGIDVMADLNRTVTYNRLAPSAIHAISSASLSSITNGKIKIVPFGQKPPTSYYLYHRAKAENLNWKFTPSSPSPGATFDKTIIYNDRVITMGKENGFQQNPVLSNWTNFYTVNNSIGSYSTALLSDNVYLIGGHDGNSKSNRLRIFNLINSSFSEGAPTPVAAQHKTAQALNGKIFEMGGWKSGNGGSRRTFCYDPVLDEWTEKSLTNFGRIHSASIVFQNKLWVIGGENNSADKVESYDTTNNNWTIEKSLKQGRKQASCWVFRDFLFVGGGKDVNGTILDSIECYDPRTETWHDWGQLPNPVSSCASFVVGDILHIFDGVGNAGVLSLDLNKSTSTLNDIYIQDLNVSAGKALVQAEVADGSVTASKIASKTIGKDQISDSILKYLKPEITSQPQAQTVFADSNISYSVTAEGKYLTYQWKKDGVDLTDETNATLNITDANATLHDGNYSVVVSNDFGSEESGQILVDVNTTWSTDGLVGWWKFDEGSGTVAYDSSGNGNDGNLTNGPTWSIGKIGGALSFDGVDDFVFLGNPPEIGLSGNQSFSMWLKPFSFNARRNPYNKAYGGTGTFTLEPNQVMTYFYGVSGTDSGPYGAYQTTSLLALNEWSNLVLTRNLVTLKVRFFFNGLLDVTLNAEHTTASIDSLSAKIGDGYTSPFHGVIDDFRIYDRALSAEEVQALYNLGQ